MEREALARQKRQLAEERAAVKALQPPNSWAAREARSMAFKHNVELHGLAKAKYIAALITKKQKGEFVGGPKARRRTIEARELGFVNEP